MVDKPATATIESQVAGLGRRSRVVGEMSRYVLIAVDANV
jgi:hypothetical protein